MLILLIAQQGLLMALRTHELFQWLGAGQITRFNGGGEHQFKPTILLMLIQQPIDVLLA